MRSAGRGALATLRENVPRIAALPGDKSVRSRAKPPRAPAPLKACNSAVADLLARCRRELADAVESYDVAAEEVRSSDAGRAAAHDDALVKEDEGASAAADNAQPRGRGVGGTSDAIVLQERLRVLQQANLALVSQNSGLRDENCSLRSELQAAVDYLEMVKPLLEPHFARGASAVAVPEEITTGSASAASPPSSPIVSPHGQLSGWLLYVRPHGRGVSEVQPWEALPRLVEQKEIGHRTLVRVSLDPASSGCLSLVGGVPDLEKEGWIEYGALPTKLGPLLRHCVPPSVC
jgi:hypothetical protein